jgi:hypothetical protein
VQRLETKAHVESADTVLGDHSATHLEELGHSAGAQPW